MMACSFVIAFSTACCAAVIMSVSFLSGLEVLTHYGDLHFDSTLSSCITLMALLILSTSGVTSVGSMSSSDNVHIFLRMFSMRSI